jgi:hypothetical protein
MVSSAAKTPDEYVDSLPPERAHAIARVREIVNANIPKGYVECMTFGMIGWCIPLTKYPDTYNGQPLGIVALCSQKQYMSLYLATYMDAKLEAWFRAEYKKRGKKLDMGKSCVRFKSLDDLPLDLVAEVVGKISVDQLIAMDQAVHGKKAKAKPKAKAKAERVSRTSRGSARAKPAGRRRTTRSRRARPSPASRRRRR